MLHKHILDCDDQFLISRAVSELGKLIRATGEPLYRELVRHPRRMPQYDVGHLGLLERVERRVAALPGLEIAGSSYHGVGIPDCVASGEKAPPVFMVIYAIWLLRAAVAASNTRLCELIEFFNPCGG